MWHVMSSKDGCHYISHISGSSDTLEFYAIKRWCLYWILLSLPGSLWLLQYMVYSRSDAMWLFRLDYKNSMPFTLLFEGFSLLELSHHIGRKLKHLRRGSHREEQKPTDPQTGLSFWLSFSSSTCQWYEWDILKVAPSAPSHLPKNTIFLESFF